MDSDLSSSIKWKCTICSKTLSSKQSVLKHIDVFHKSSDYERTSKCFMKVTVSGSSKTKAGNQKGIVKKKNTKAVAFSTNLSKAFQDKRLFESFSLSTSQSIPSVSNQDADEISKHNGNLNLLPPSRKPVAFIPPLRSDGFSVPEKDNQAEHDRESSNDFSVTGSSSSEGLDAREGINFEYGDIFPLSGPSNSENIPSVKTRGHCDDTSCIGCKTPPCGTCYNCKNKKKLK